MVVSSNRNNGLVPQSLDGGSLISYVCAKEVTVSLVPDDGTDLHSVVAVAIRADDFIGVAFVEASLYPASNDLFWRDIIILVAALARGVGLFRYMLQPVSDDFPGRDIMSVMAASAKGVNFLSRVHGLGRGNVVFIVLVCGRLTVAIDTANVNLDMTFNKSLSLVIGMAYKAGRVFNCCPVGCNGRIFFLFGRFVKEQRGTRVDYKGWRSSSSFGLGVSGRSRLDVGRLRLVCGCAAKKIRVGKRQKHYRYFGKTVIYFHLLSL